MTYSGPDYVDVTKEARLTNCLYGGVAFEAGSGKHWNYTTSFDEVVRSYRNDHMIEVQYLCDNYTSDINNYETLGKIMMNIVGHSKDGLLLAIYSYEKYSQVSMEATATSTQCKGIPYHKSK